MSTPKLKTLLSPDALIELDAAMAAAHLIHISEEVRACRDATDDKFLDLAINGRADLLITGDSDLLALGAFRDIPVIAPVTFLRAYYPGGPG